MPRLQALKDTTLPPGIIGPPQASAGAVITVDATEAALLLATGDWVEFGGKPAVPVTRNRAIAQADFTKAQADVGAMFPETEAGPLTEPDAVEEVACGGDN